MAVFSYFICKFVRSSEEETTTKTEKLMLMLLDIFGFLKFSFTDVLDILLVALIIYLVFRWIQDSSVVNIFIAIIAIFFLKVVADALKMKLMSSLLATFIDVGVIALIVIFQPEIRHFLMRLGSGTSLGRKGRALMNRLLGREEHQADSSDVNEITEACRTMSEQKTGALIVLTRSNTLESVAETGDRIDSRINRRLIMNIFFKNSPLHDGAMIISGRRIEAARCTLPITSRQDIPASYGMRHKAAIGITEETDADVIVVSEETGGISFGRNGNLQSISNINELKLLLGSSMSSNG